MLTLEWHKIKISLSVLVYLCSFVLAQCLPLVSSAILLSTVSVCKILVLISFLEPFCCFSQTPSISLKPLLSNKCNSWHCLIHLLPLFPSFKTVLILISSPCSPGSGPCCQQGSGFPFRRLLENSPSLPCPSCAPSLSTPLLCVVWRKEEATKLH